MPPHRHPSQLQTLHLESSARIRPAVGTVEWTRLDTGKNLGRLQESSRVGVSQRMSIGHTT